MTPSATGPNSALQNTVKAEQKQLAADTQFVKDHKGDLSALAGKIADIQKDWEAFQGDSSALQNTGNGDDIKAAHDAEVGAFDSFNDIHGDLQDAVHSAQASGDPNAAALGAGFASITDQGNANALHLQAINNNSTVLNANGAGIDNQYSATIQVLGANSQYGDSNGAGIATGGTRSVQDVAAEASSIRIAAGLASPENNSHVSSVGVDNP